MISSKVIEDAMFEAMRLAATRLPPDVKTALERVLSEETEPLARAHIEACLKNAELSVKGCGLVCGDTGFPLYFVKISSDVRIEGGAAGLMRAAERATARATSESYLRPTMVDPISRSNPGDNLGPGMPKVELNFAERGEGLEIIAAPKGGGSEIFGTFYKMLFPSDGLAGIKKFVLDCLRNSSYAGKVCPPAIVGVGIGGTSDLSMRLAKEAALLRPLGSRNPDPLLAELEDAIVSASRKMGIGPMGSKGVNCVLGVHIAKAMTHTAALPVAFNSQCLVGRRWKAVISADGNVSFTGEI